MKITYRSAQLLLFTALLFGFLFVGGYEQTAYAQVNLNVPDKTTEPVRTSNLANNPIIEWIEFFINLLTVIIIAGAAIMLAVAGVQYTSSRDNAQTTQAAKDKIFNVLLGLVAYFFLYGFVQWLIPGGVF